MNTHLSTSSSSARRRAALPLAAAALFAATAALGDPGSGMKALPNHVPVAVAHSKAMGILPPTARLRLAIGLPLRNASVLDEFLAQICDPASRHYRQYLSPEQFTERFGPSTEGYQAVIEFAQVNGLSVAATHRNRLLLDVTGSVADIQRAFHITLRTYRHPSEARDFFAPDTEPSVEARLPICDISGLNTYGSPHPMSLERVQLGSWGRTSPRVPPLAPPPARSLNPSGPTPLSTPGSGPGGGYVGQDLRAAYFPGVTLTGSGQMVGLLEFDGFYASDITAYETAVGQPDVPIQTVLLDGFDGVPTPGPYGGNQEVSLDIEMAMAMAPGLSQIVVFEAGPAGVVNDILNAMAASNQVKQFSCSWGWAGGPNTTTDNIFKQMAAQGQSFFAASGDSDAYTTGAVSVNGVDNPSLGSAPSSCPYITIVGGTTLSTTGPAGSWASETVWNAGSHYGQYVGSSGGISSYYPLPAWQAGIDMTANGGSTTQRNLPDVALTADNLYATGGNGSSGALCGTSCAAPLWAGVAALINQQAVAAGRGTVGFLNPALYALAKGPTYNSIFHDVTSGNNCSQDNPSLFYATVGYDLCTGWGTPAGQSFIDSLAGAANPLVIAAPGGFTCSGPMGGPFTPNSGTFWLTNTGTAPLTWSLVNTSAWLSLSPIGGTLAPASSSQVAASLTAAACRLLPGTYAASLPVSNGKGGTLAATVTLAVGQSVVQNGGFETGNFSGWTLVGDTTSYYNIYNAVEGQGSGFDVVHSGNFGAFLGDTQLASLSQTIATVPGQYYLLSLWLDNPGSGTGQQFILNWSTNASTPTTLFSVTSPPAFAWTNLQFLVSATDTNTTLQIQAENYANYFGLDDIAVTPIPAPTFQTAVASGNDFLLCWLTAPGLAYQVQYKTDLAQLGWVNLGGSFVATNSTSTLLDSNAIRSAPKRYYRVVVSVPLP